jgi:hypothetical protein
MSCFGIVIDTYFCERVHIGLALDSPKQQQSDVGHKQKNENIKISLGSRTGGVSGVLRRSRRNQRR